MRRLLVGIFLLCFLIPGPVLAETKGEVQSLGFQWHYRPNCHVPMLVRVQADKSGTYQIQVIQEDMDRDQQVFVETVSLTGAEEGQAAEQRFWLYFIPQPTNGGLSGLSLRELQQVLKVFLCDESGRQICQLPVTQTPISVDDVQAGPVASRRGTKLIVAVSDSAAQPIWRDYQYALGTLEDVIFVTVRSSELPEDVRGFESIDGIVWLSAPALDAAKPAEEKRYHAIREYVRSGGHLVICQPAQREATAEWDDLLPVTVQDVAPRETLEPLRTLARADQQHRQEQSLDAEDRRGPGTNDWDRPQGPFMFARAQLKPKAVAENDLLLDWKDGTAPTPYLARIGYGAGAVTWVAHDLADPAITIRAKSGWPFVWDRVLAYNDNILIVDQQTTELEKAPYAQGPSVEISSTLPGGMDLIGKTRILVAIAVVFFIAYWVVAGPGVYLWLLTKTRAHLSWFMFALAALVATALTVLVVRLVVRGPPDMKHITIVRAAAGEEMVSISQFGLYIPRDGGQSIALPGTAGKRVSYITAYPLHPSIQQGDMDFPARARYFVPQREAESDEPVNIDVPYRSTMKKFQVRRVGEAGGIVGGSGKLRMNEQSGGLALEGLISNGTGHLLRNVHIVYRHPDEREGEDVVLFQPNWPDRSSIDLAKDFSLPRAKLIGARNSQDNPNVALPARDGVNLSGPIGSTEVGWPLYWFPELRNRSNSVGDTSLNNLSLGFQLMSLFTRLPPMQVDNLDRRNGRAELLRRSGRHLDISSAIAAGRLVVLAEADGDAELPFPLDVEGDTVAGKGTLFYQFILPLEHPPIETFKPTTQAAALDGSP